MKHAYAHYGAVKKWFVKLDDDSFVVVPRLVQQLMREDPTVPHYMGKHHNNWGDIYCEGGAGYIYSIGTYYNLFEAYYSEFNYHKRKEIKYFYQIYFPVRKPHSYASD